MSRQRIATAVLLTRGAGEGVEVFGVLRAPELRFFGGYWAFPGGVLDPADEGGDGGEERALLCCALRELFGKWRSFAPSRPFAADDRREHAPESRPDRDPGSAAQDSSSEGARP